MTPDPVPDAVLRAVRSIPTARTARTAPEQESYCCPRCFEERAREQQAEDWRRLRSET